MKSKHFVLGFVCVIMSICLLILGMITTAAEAKTVKWKWMTPLVRATNSIPHYVEMCKRITERSGGRLKVDPFVYGEHPYTGADMLGAVRDGLVDMGMTEDVYISSVEPPLGIMMVPFLFKDIDQAKKVMERMVPEVFEPILNKKYNSTIITSYLICGEAVHGKKLLDSMDALKGQKIRVWGKETGDTVAHLGGTPVTVAFGELYTAIQRGTIDGALTSMNGAVATKIHEVAKYVTWWDFAFPWEFTIVNRDKLKALPEDVQKIIREEGKRASDACQAMNELEPASDLVRMMQKYGVVATALTPKMHKQVQEKVRPVWTDWAKRAGSEGAKALKIYDEVSKSMK